MTNDDSRYTEEGARALGATDSLDYSRLSRKPFRTVKAMSHILARQQYPDHPHLRGAYIRAYQLGCRQERIRRIAVADAQLDVDALSQEALTLDALLLPERQEDTCIHASNLYALKNWKDRCEALYVASYVDAHGVALQERAEQQRMNAEGEEELATAHLNHKTREDEASGNQQLCYTHHECWNSISHAVMQ